MFFPAMLKDKIVIMGYLGADLTDTSYGMSATLYSTGTRNTPEKSRPDMYEVCRSRQHCFNDSRWRIISMN